MRNETAPGAPGRHRIANPRSTGGETVRKLLGGYGLVSYYLSFPLALLIAMQSCTAGVRHSSSEGLDQAEDRILAAEDRGQALRTISGMRLLDAPQSMLADPDALSWHEVIDEGRAEESETSKALQDIIKRYDAWTVDPMDTALGGDEIAKRDDWARERVGFLRIADLPVATRNEAFTLESLQAGVKSRRKAKEQTGETAVMAAVTSGMTSAMVTGRKESYLGWAMRVLGGLAVEVFVQPWFSAIDQAPLLWDDEYVPLQEYKGTSLYSRGLASIAVGDSGLQVAATDILWNWGVSPASFLWRAVSGLGLLMGLMIAAFPILGGRYVMETFRDGRVPTARRWLFSCAACILPGAIYFCL